MPRNRFGATAKASDGFITRVAGFTGAFDEEIHAASTSIDERVHEIIDERLMDSFYQGARRKATLPVPIPAVNSIPTDSERGGATRGGIPYASILVLLAFGTPVIQFVIMVINPAVRRETPSGRAPGVLLAVGLPHEMVYGKRYLRLIPNKRTVFCSPMTFPIFQ